MDIIREKTENMLKNEVVNADKKLKNIIDKKFEVRNTYKLEKQTNNRIKASSNKNHKNHTNSTATINTSNNDNSLNPEFDNNHAVVNDNNNNNNTNCNTIPVNNNKSISNTNIYNNQHDNQHNFNNKHTTRRYNNRGRGNFHRRPHQNQQK